MKENTRKDTQLMHVRVKNSLVKKFDIAAKRVGYRSRSEAISALMAALCYKATPEERGDVPVPASFTAWADSQVPKVSEEDIRRSLEEALRGLAFPRIAIKGMKEAFESVGREVLFQVHDDTGVWLSEGEVEEAFEQFELLNRRQLYDHRHRYFDAFSAESAGGDAAGGAAGDAEEVNN